MTDKTVLPAVLPSDGSGDLEGIEATLLSADQFRALLSPARQKKLQAESDPGKCRRWIGYGRFSLEEQDPDSLLRQKAKLAPLWSKPGDQLVGWLTDAGRSGTTMHNRPGLARGLAMVRARECDAFGVEDVDRLSRSVAQLLLMYEEMQQYGVELWDSKNGKLSWIQVYFFGMMAQLGRERMLELMAGGRIEKIKKGRVFAGLIFGYMNHKQKRKLRVVDEDLRAVVVWIFERIASGATCYQVAKDLCAKYPGPRPNAGKRRKTGDKPPFDEKFVERLIRNELYMGVNLWGRRKQIRDFTTRQVTGIRETPLSQQLPVMVPHLAIVTTGLWARANAALDERAPGAGHGGKRIGPFSGRWFCACGAPLVRTGPEDRRELRCETAGAVGAIRCSNTSGLPLAWVEATLLDRIAIEVEGQALAARCRASVTGLVAAAKSRIVARRTAMTAQVAAIAHDLDRLSQEDYIAGYSRAWLAARRQKLEEDKGGLERELAVRDDFTALDAIVSELTDFGAAVAEIREHLPFRVQSAEDQALVDIVRDIVKRVSVRASSKPGHVRFVLHMRLGDEGLEAERSEDVQLTLPLGDLFDTGLDHVVEFEADRGEARRNAASVAAERRAAERDAVAGSGVHDVSDAVWRIVAPLLGATHSGPLVETVTPRRAFDGIFFALKHPKTDFEKLPEVFCSGKTIYHFLRRIARDGTLDRVVAALRQAMPEALAGCDLSKLHSSRLPRGKAASCSRRGRAEGDDTDVRRLLEAADATGEDAAGRERMLAVAAYLAGAPGRQAAADHGYGTSYLTELVGRYRTHDIDGLRSKRRPQRKGAIEGRLVEEIRDYVAQAFDPDRPGRPLTPAKVAEFVKRKGVEIGIEHLSRRMRAKDISIRAALKAVRAKRDGSGATPNPSAPAAPD